MPVPGGGFEQAYNAQAAVDTDSLLVVAPALTQATNDKQQVVPMLEQLQALPEDLGRVKRLLADTGYASEDNVNACAQAQDPALDCAGPRSPSWRVVRTLRRAGATARQADAVGGDAASVADAPRAQAVCVAQMHRRTGLRVDQAGHEIPAILAARNQPARAANGVWCVWHGT